MENDWDTLSLPAGTDVLLRDVIHERLGVFYEQDRRAMMLEKLAPLALGRGMDSWLDYYYVLKYDDGNEDEWDRVINTLSVQETWFWREPDQIHALVEILLPRYLAQFPGMTVRIWSAACATGEEPLSLAMALDEAGWYERANIDIFASDASPAAIEKARRGLFRERALRNLTDERRARYFTAEPGGWRIAPALQQRIHWRTANLLHTPDIRLLATVPFIFCRNVFIYFSEQALRQTVEFFAQQMLRPGYLFTGAAESLLKVTTALDLQEIGRAFVYVKQ